MKNIMILLWHLATSFIYCQDITLSTHDIYVPNKENKSLNINKLKDDKFSIIKNKYGLEISYVNKKIKAGVLGNPDYLKKIFFVIDSLKIKANFNEKEIAFFKFPDNPRFGVLDCFFYLPNKNSFVSMDNKVVVGLENLILFKYGSSKKYQELLDRDKAYKNIIGQNKDSILAWIIADYQISQEAMPKDTSRAYKLFFKDLDKQINLSGDEHNLIEKKIKHRIKYKLFEKNYLTSYSVNIFGIELITILEEVLDQQRLNKSITFFNFRRKVRNNFASTFYPDYMKQKTNEEEYNDYLGKLFLK